MFAKSILTAFVAGLAAFAQAQDLFDPSSNPTKTPSINENVVAGTPYVLSWTPTTTGPVSIQIIAGSSQSTLGPVGYAAEGVANSGSVSWTPSNALASYAVIGYKVIDVATGKFQYSVPFKVVPGAEVPTTTPSSTPTTTPSSTPSAYPTYTPPAKPTTVPTYAPVPTTLAPYTPIASGTAPGYNTTIIQPTGSLTVPSGLYPTASEFPGAASARKAGLGLVGAAAAFAFML